MRKLIAGLTVGLALGFVVSVHGQDLNSLLTYFIQDMRNGTLGVSVPFTKASFGGSTASFPMLKQSSATLQVRLADDSAFGSFQPGSVGINAAVPGVGAMAMTGKVTLYNNVTTAGMGVPMVVAAGRTTAQTAANASVATYTVGAADGSFDVSANVLVTTATTHAFTVTCAYTDEGSTARTLTLSFTLVAGGTLVTSVANANGAVPYLGIPQHIRAKAATTITVATTGTFTTVTYNAEGTIKQTS